MGVSSGHVSNGGLFGIGIVTGKARWRTIATISACSIARMPDMLRHP